mgnify:CR=1 FL=1
MRQYAEPDLFIRRRNIRYLLTVLLNIISIHRGIMAVIYQVIIEIWICMMCMIMMIQKIFIMIMSMNLMIYKMRRTIGKRIAKFAIKVRRGKKNGKEIFIFANWKHRSH